MRINTKELAHYIVGAGLLLVAWPAIMDFTGQDLALTAVLWTLWYIVIDQILHVVIKNEPINIVR